MFRWLTPAFCALAVLAQPPRPPDSLGSDFEAHWTIQSSAKVPQTGERISTAGFDTTGWYPARVPSTVIGTLVANKVYPDPYFGMNLRSIPGTTYDVGDNFSNLPMPPESPFAVSWWYRREIRLRTVPGERLWLAFDAINYRADIWLNGRRIAGESEVRGMYRSFEFDITDAAVTGVNVFAVEVFAPTEQDLSITFVDWNPLPADKDMGIVRGVHLRRSGPVSLRNAQVISRLNSTLDQATLELYGDLTNTSARQVTGTLNAVIGDIQASQRVVLGAHQTATAGFSPVNFPQLRIRNPELWWPYGMGPQNLHRLHMEFVLDSGVSDSQDVQFGIREFTSELDAARHRVFRVNGKRILIRGGGWTHDMMLRVDPEREENEIRYVRDMHLNAIRLEGKMLDENLFDLADRYGILVMPGWCCCNFWEQWERWTPEHYTVSAESLRTQLRRLRNHASVFVFLYGSDVAPDPPAERNYLAVLAQERWPNPYIASATTSDTLIGLTGVKMTGPYDWVPPNYWLLDRRWGGAFGFNTETSPGFAIPVLESLRQMLPPDHLWPTDDTWQLHATTYIPNMAVYTAALEARYGKAAGLEDFVEKSQVMAYEGERAMFEAFGRNKYAATGVIQWMLNNAWPSTAWHLYDYYLRPGGGYFGSKKANEPLHVQYSYDDRSIVVVNSLYREFRGYRVTAAVYNLNLTEKFSRTVPVDLAEDSATRVFTIPELAGLSRTYFVKLTLQDQDGAPAGSNFYWLSTQDDEVDTAAQTDFFYTPIKTYADLTDLQGLPQARVTATSQAEVSGDDRVEHVTVRNTSSALAFFVHLTVLRDDGSDIAPVYWEDNYFELMPGEQREIAVSYPRKLLGGSRSHIRVDGWNVVASVN